MRARVVGAAGRVRSRTRRERRRSRPRPRSRGSRSARRKRLAAGTGCERGPPCIRLRRAARSGGDPERPTCRRGRSGASSSREQWWKPERHVRIVRVNGLGSPAGTGASSRSGARSRARSRTHTRTDPDDRAAADHDAGTVLHDRVARDVHPRQRRGRAGPVAPGPAWHLGTLRTDKRHALEPGRGLEPLACSLRVSCSAS